MKDVDMSVRATTSPTPLDAWTSVATAGLETREQLRERLATQPQAPGIELCLVRHGETTTNAAGLFTGQTDAPLNVRGRLQAQDAGRKISGRAFHIGFSSQLERSTETLSLMTRAGDLTIPFTVADARLAERSYGELERTPIRPRDPRLAVDLTLAPTGGESYIALTRRILSFLLDLRELAAALRRPLAVIISTHMGPMRVLTAILDETSDPIAMRNANFANGAVVERVLGPLAWPAFAGGLPSSSAQTPEIPEFLK
jgi:broad specificity phosphatase PhoE